MTRNSTRERLLSTLAVVALVFLTPGPSRGQSASPSPETIPKGSRLVSVEVDGDSGSAHLIRPHDRVDVLVRVQRNPPRQIENLSTQTLLLEDIEVFAVDQKVVHDDAEYTDTPDKRISLLVTPMQAESLILASEMGKIRVVKRGAR